jgi:sarcosine oxidase subunit alpha
VVQRGKGHGDAHHFARVSHDRPTAMTGHRLDSPWGALIDRSKPVTFEFNRKRITGFAGDTVASALVANGIMRVGRSFKLHRPRGVFSCGVEEPNAIVDVGIGIRRDTNVRATLLPVQEGLSVRNVNCWPNVEFDIGALCGVAAPILHAGFYYKTFKWPNWHWFEPTIRRMAGLGHVSGKPDPDCYDEVAAEVDVLVVGGGVAGLAAAAAATERGARVTLVTQGSRLGANALWRAPTVDSRALMGQLNRFGAQVLVDSVAFGLYDHNLVCVREMLRTPLPHTGPTLRERLWKFRARNVISACGAFERPMIFPDNDRPGVMLAGAAQKYAHAYGVGCGSRVVIAANCDSAYAVARTLRLCGLEIVAIADCRPGELIRSPIARSEEFCTIRNAAITAVRGSREVRGCIVSDIHDRRTARALDCDLILGAGGLAPAVHLHSQAGGGLRWDQDGSMFVPDRVPAGVFSVGAANGVFDLSQALEHARDTGAALAQGKTPPPPTSAFEKLEPAKQLCVRHRWQAVHRSPERRHNSRRRARRA